MADKDKNVKRTDKTAKGHQNALQKIAAFFVKAAKGLKNFFAGLKAELKRVVWPDRRRLIQSTATVLVICLLVGVALFAVDNIVGGLLKAIGFYSTSGTTATTAATTVSTTVSTTAASETTAAETTPAETSSAG
jgi:preprotein translocase subunit SecE